MKISIFFLYLSILVFTNVCFGLYLIDCFEYYKFQNGILFDALNPKKISYSPGEDAIFSYNLVSMMEAPVTEGRVRIQVFYNDVEEGEIILDEFFLNEKISISFGDVISKEFKWKVPKDAKNGEYIVKTYFIVGKFFNLAGLSFLAYGPPGAPGAYTTFNINNTKTESRIYFSKKNTYFNGEKYNFGSFFPEIKQGENVKIESELVNEGETKNVNVEISIYEWDDTTESPIGEYTKRENFVLEKNSKKKILFEIPNLKPGAYQVKFVAIAGEEKSILKIRFSVVGEKGRFIFLGVDKFPIRQKENVTLFICLSNSADYFTNFNGTIKVYAYDKEGKLIFKNESKEEILPKPIGFASNFISDRDYKYITIVGEIYGSDGSLHDREIITYDYSSFPFISRFLSIETDKESYLVNENVSYIINYKDNENYPLSGILVIEFIDADGKTFAAHRIRIEGKYEKSMKISSPGTYKIVVFDTINNIKSEKTIKVVEEKLEREEKIFTFDIKVILASIAIFVLCIILIYKFVLRKKKYETF